MNTYRKQRGAVLLGLQGGGPAPEFTRPVLLKPLYRGHQRRDRFALALVANLRRPAPVVSDRLHPILHPLYVGHERAIRLLPRGLWHPQPFTHAPTIRQPVYRMLARHIYRPRLVMLMGPREAVAQRPAALLRPIFVAGAEAKITTQRVQMLWRPMEEPPPQPVGTGVWHPYY